MTVGELISYLGQFNPDLPVVYQCYSEQVLMSPHEIQVGELQEPREDGWVHNARPDRPTTKYLVFPGN